MKKEDLVIGNQYRINKPKHPENAYPTWVDGMDYLDQEIIVWEEHFVNSGDTFECDGYYFNPEWLTEVNTSVAEGDETTTSSGSSTEPKWLLCIKGCYYEDTREKPFISKGSIYEVSGTTCTGFEFTNDFGDIHYWLCTDDGSSTYWEIYDSEEEAQIAQEKLLALQEKEVESLAKLQKTMFDAFDEAHVNSGKEWTDNHYDFTYQHPVTRGDSDVGYVEIKIDPYFVASQWRLGEKDNSGVLFHSVKTCARFGDKNTKEREIRALHAQIKRLAELNGVDL